MTKEYVQTVGRVAYMWGWPLVNKANRAKAFSEAPEPGLLGGVVPIAYNRIAMLTDTSARTSASSPARTRTSCMAPASCAGQGAHRLPGPGFR